MSSHMQKKPVNQHKKLAMGYAVKPAPSPSVGMKKGGKVCPPASYKKGS